MFSSKSKSISTSLLSPLLLMDSIQVVLWLWATAACMLRSYWDTELYCIKHFTMFLDIPPTHLHWSPTALLRMAGKDLALRKHSSHSHDDMIAICILKEFLCSYITDALKWLHDWLVRDHKDLQHAICTENVFQDTRQLTCKWFLECYPLEKSLFK